MIKGGPQLCVVSHRLDSLWTFLQEIYLNNATAAELNGSWDTTWFTWSKAGHAELGPECEMIPGAQQVAPMVRVKSKRAHKALPKQTNANYPAVVFWLFITRDYRAYREGVPGAKKPSLLGILASTDFFSPISPTASTTATSPACGRNARRARPCCVARLRRRRRAPCDQRQRHG